MADTVQACFSMISASLLCFSAAFCSEIITSSVWDLGGRTTDVASAKQL